MRKGEVLQEIRSYPDIELLVRMTFDVGMEIHQDIGPGLIESVYERVLADRLFNHGIKVDRQQPVHVNIYGKRYDEAFRYDLLLNESCWLKLNHWKSLGQSTANRY